MVITMNLKTERLVLEEMAPEHREFILKQFSDSDVNRYLFDAEPMTTVCDADELISFYMQDEPKDRWRFIITLAESGEPIGTLGFHCYNSATKSAETGYDMQKAYWGQGYMSEAYLAVLRFAKEELGIQRLEAHIYPENINSLRFAERMGFLKTSRHMNEVFRGKTYVHDIYELELV